MMAKTTKKPKFTFRRHAQETGLAATGRPYPDVDIKLNGKKVGIIYAPTWTTPDNLYRVSLMVKDANSKIGWGWARLKGRWESEKAARDDLSWLAEEIVARFQLHHHEDDE